MQNMSSTLIISLFVSGTGLVIWLIWWFLLRKKTAPPTPAVKPKAMEEFMSHKRERGMSTTTGSAGVVRSKSSPVAKDKG